MRDLVQYSTVQYSTVLDHEGPLVQLVIGQQPAAVQQVVRRLLDRVDLVRGLLELPHLADNVGNLYNTKNIQAFIKSTYLSSYHSHLGKVEEPRVCEVGRALLDVGEVGQVDAEVGHTRRVTPAKIFTSS